MLRRLPQGYLSHLGDPAITEQLLHRMRSATNMTDEIAALALLDRAGKCDAATRKRKRAEARKACAVSLWC
jgi:hypothetical protein